MSDQYIGEIRMFGGNFAPQGWNFCDGSLQSISENETLFNVLGTTYGGDGVTTFGLPDLRGRIPIHLGTDANGISYILGQFAGTENVTLISQQMPQHSHPPLGSSTGGSASPSGNTYGSGETLYSSAAPSVALSSSTVANAGSSQPHSNLMPYLCLNFIIALYGIYPSAS